MDPVVYANLDKLESFVAQEYANGIVYPEFQHIFKCLDLVAPQECKVVILGQDPYHGPGQAQGLSFSVPDFCKYPPSLRNIFKELQSEFGSMPDNGDLSHWAQQGVLLLNTILTVRGGAPASHQKQGWEQFSAEILRSLSKNHPKIIFMLWGKHAQLQKCYIEANNHLVLESAHPSPFSARKGFFGCMHFKTANDFLIKNQQSPIQWVN
ncbi:MAG: uracil-DNA glycosylase [Luteibaculaceae bacterium]|jgi:uracil-DNA glycosylase